MVSAGAVRCSLSLFTVGSWGGRLLYHRRAVDAAVWTFLVRVTETSPTTKPGAVGFWLAPLEVADDSHDAVESQEIDGAELHALKQQFSPFHWLEFVAIEVVGS